MNSLHYSSTPPHPPCPVLQNAATYIYHTGRFPTWSVYAYRAFSKTQRSAHVSVMIVRGSCVCAAAYQNPGIPIYPTCRKTNQENTIYQYKTPTGEYYR